MSDEVSGLVLLHFFMDNAGNLTTATPVDQPLAGDGVHLSVKAPQAGCLRAIMCEILTTPNTANPDLVAAMTLDGTESVTGIVAIPIGDTQGSATFANGEVTFEEGEEIGASVEMTGGTIDDAVDETSIFLLLQLGRSNI